MDTKGCLWILADTVTDRDSFWSEWDLLFCLLDAFKPARDDVGSLDRDDPSVTVDLE
jgi:hypothetical protein